MLPITVFAERAGQLKSRPRGLIPLAATSSDAVSRSSLRCERLPDRIENREVRTQRRYPTQHADVVQDCELAGGYRISRRRVDEASPNIVAVLGRGRHERRGVRVNQHEQFLSVQ